MLIFTRLYSKSYFKIHAVSLLYTKINLWVLFRNTIVVYSGNHAKDMYISKVTAVATWRTAYFCILRLCTLPYSRFIGVLRFSRVDSDYFPTRRLFDIMGTQSFLWGRNRDFMHYLHEYPTNHSEIAWIVRHLKPRKAAGPDDIQDIILQHLPRPVLKFIAKIFNSSLALDYFACFPCSPPNGNIEISP
jgi:hypothetical protein